MSYLSLLLIELMFQLNVYFHNLNTSLNLQSTGYPKSEPISFCLFVKAADVISKTSQVLECQEGRGFLGKEVLKQR